MKLKEYREIIRDKKETLLGQNVFFLKENTVCKGKLLKIKLEDRHYNVDFVVKKNNITMRVSRIFRSQAHLIEYLSNQIV
jgi:hypothetical protein